MSVIEKTIEYFAPRSALKRKAAKLRLRSIEAASRKPRIAHWGAHEKTKILISKISQYIGKERPYSKYCQSQCWSCKTLISGEISKKANL